MNKRIKRKLEKKARAAAGKSHLEACARALIEAVVGGIKTNNYGNWVMETPEIMNPELLIPEIFAKATKKAYIKEMLDSINGIVSTSTHKHKKRII